MSGYVRQTKIIVPAPQYLRLLYRLGQLTSSFLTIKYVVDDLRCDLETKDLFLTLHDTHMTISMVGCRLESVSSGGGAYNNAINDYQLRRILPPHVQKLASFSIICPVGEENSVVRDHHALPDFKMVFIPGTPRLSYNFFCPELSDYLQGVSEGRPFTFPEEQFALAEIVKQVRKGDGTESPEVLASRVLERVDISNLSLRYISTAIAQDVDTVVDDHFDEKEAISVFNTMPEGVDYKGKLQGARFNMGSVQIHELKEGKNKSLNTQLKETETVVLNGDEVREVMKDFHGLLKDVSVTFAKRYNLAELIVSNGIHPITIVRRETEFTVSRIEIPDFRTEIHDILQANTIDVTEDPTGCGDTFSMAFYLARDLFPSDSDEKHVGFATFWAQVTLSISGTNLKDLSVTVLQELHRFISSFQPWFVYIVECSDRTLYTGITTNVESRISDHNSSIKGAKYTRARRPVELVYSRQMNTRSEASKEEHRIKQLSRSEKLQLIQRVV